jgi:uncharacterized membrane protein YdjX (TVP38/TMEM64 family)
MATTNRTKKTKFLLIIVLLILISLFFVFDLTSHLSFGNIKEHQDSILSFYSEHVLLVSSAFFVSYIIITALSLPAASTLTILAGALFGFWYGLLIASFASTIGATLAFLISRFLLLDVIQDKYKDSLKKINAGFTKEGSFYLFALRLVPLFPFFMINLVMGVLPIRAFTFYWVSQAGMLPGTAVYVFAGTELAKISSPADILSPGLLIAFSLLGLLPLIGRHSITYMRKNKDMHHEKI